MMAQNSSSSQVRPIVQRTLPIVTSQLIPAPPLVPISTKSRLITTTSNSEVRIPIYFESDPTQSYASESSSNTVITSSGPAPKIRLVSKPETTLPKGQVTNSAGKSRKNHKKTKSGNSTNVEDSDDTEQLSLRELVVLKTRKKEYMRFMKFAEDHLPKYKFLSKPRRREYKQALIMYINDLHFARALEAKRHRK